ncbi:MAG: RluA family pseudouridine synthase [Gammaproteobacteria bacterium]|nr:RluA family pseudouridine synthase [Gammaproteobacteria bacterium]
MDNKGGVQQLEVDENHTQQRIDNFLFSQLKGVPKSRIYKALRKGEVRVNKKRVKPEYKLQLGDILRLPPFRTPMKDENKPAVPGTRLSELIKTQIMMEDNDLIILNKPAGIAVHGGSGISFGVIEILRALNPRAKFLELVHRLDRDTSGCLLIAKKSSVLKEIHSLLIAREVTKTYWLLVAGKCDFKEETVEAPLQKNILKSGERIVVVDEEGKSAKTIFKCIKHIGNLSLLEAKPVTGRTHQIRVHAAYLGHPIVGDDKYGDHEVNKECRRQGINQLCLHSSSIEFYLQSKERKVAICALLKEPWVEHL